MWKRSATFLGGREGDIQKGSGTFLGYTPRLTFSNRMDPLSQYVAYDRLDSLSTIAEWRSTKIEQKRLYLGQYFLSLLSTILSRLLLRLHRRKTRLPRPLFSSFHIDFCHACWFTDKRFCEINTSRKQQTLHYILYNDRWLTKMKWFRFPSFLPSILPCLVATYLTTFFLS